jgi:hypothetical protein
MMPSQVTGPLVAAGLLVGGEAQHQRARRHDAGPGTRPHAGEQHRVEVLHVDRAATPDHAVADLARERVHGPVLCRRRYDIEVTVQQDRLSAAATPPRDDRRAAGFGLEQLGADADLVEQLGDVLGRLALAGTRLVAAVVGGVDRDQVAADLHDLGRSVVVGRGHGPILP